MDTLEILRQYLRSNVGPIFGLRNKVRKMPSPPFNCHLCLVTYLLTFRSTCSCFLNQKRLLPSKKERQRPARKDQLQVNRPLRAVKGRVRQRLAPPLLDVPFAKVHESHPLNEVPSRRRTPPQQVKTHISFISRNQIVCPCTIRMHFV